MKHNYVTKKCSKHKIKQIKFVKKVVSKKNNKKSCKQIILENFGMKKRRIKVQKKMEHLDVAKLADNYNRNGEYGKPMSLCHCQLPFHVCFKLLKPRHLGEMKRQM